jgi:hypothetical protein
LDLVVEEVPVVLAEVIIMVALEVLDLRFPQHSEIQFLHPQIRQIHNHTKEEVV